MKIEYTPSFIDGAGSGALLPGMWEHAEPLVTDAFAISLEDAAAGVRTLARTSAHRRRGRSGASRRGGAGRARREGRVVCIVSGGNIDSARLAAILEGRVPD